MNPDELRTRNSTGITKGQPWGSATCLPPDAPIAYSNQQLREIVEPVLREASARVTATAAPLTVGVAGGDIWSAVGAPSNSRERFRRGTTHGAVIDAICVQTDTDQYWCCAHVVARRSWWRGHIVAIMNSEWLRRWRVAPAAHPGDGYLRVVEATPQYRITQRLLARRRLRTGDHLPHPHLSSKRVTQASFEFDKPTSLWLDGTNVGKARALAVEVMPAAVQIIY